MPNVTVTLPGLEYTYLTTALEGLARQRCNRRNCGSVCLCDACAARRVLPLVRENAKIGPTTKGDDR